MSSDGIPYGLMAEFGHQNQLLEAANRAYAQGYRRMDAYAPFFVEGLAEALGHKGTSIPLLDLIGGLLGGGAGYFMQWFAMAADYPLNIGGRPLHSWPAFIPITFELTILGAALFGMLGMLLLNGLPRPHHPVFNVPEFDRASVDRFFLCLETSDPKFEMESARRFLEDQHPITIREVKA